MNNNFNDDQTNVINSQEFSTNGFSNNMGNGFNNQQIFNHNGENVPPMGQSMQYNVNNLEGQNNSNQPNHMQGNNQPNGNGMNQNNAKNKLILKIVLIVLIVIVGLFVLKKCSNSSLLGGHKNTTGSSEYSAKDVDLNCTYEASDSNRKLTSYVDVIFNYKSTAKDGTTYRYQLIQYNKKVNEYPNGVSDEIYREYIDSLNAIKCAENNSACAKSHLELGMTSLGFDTVVDRTGNQIVVTFYNVIGLGQKATKKDIREFRKTYEDSGLKCS